MFNDLGSLFSGHGTAQKAINDGKGVLDRLLGAKTIGLVHLIARDTDIRPDEVSLLMAMLAPFVLHALACESSTAAGPAGLTVLLGEQKNVVTNLLPVGIAPLLAWSGNESAEDDQKLYDMGFRSLRPREFVSLVLAGEWKNAAPGEKVLTEGQPVSSICIAISGTVQIQRHGEELGAVTGRNKGRSVLMEVDDKIVVQDCMLQSLAPSKNYGFEFATLVTERSATNQFQDRGRQFSPGKRA